jgi:hypothetical protein
MPTPIGPDNILLPLTVFAPPFTSIPEFGGPSTVLAMIVFAVTVAAEPSNDILKPFPLPFTRLLSTVPDTGPRSNTPSVPPYTPLFPVSLIVFDFTLSVRELDVFVFPQIPKPGAILMGAALFRVSMGMVSQQLPATAAASKPSARRLLQATIIYLPALFALMMVNAGG